MQLEHIVLVDVLRLRGDGEGVAQQRQAGEGVTVLQQGTAETLRKWPVALGRVAVLVKGSCSGLVLDGKKPILASVPWSLQEETCSCRVFTRLSLSVSAPHPP